MLPGRVAEAAPTQGGGPLGQPPLGQLGQPSTFRAPQKTGLKALYGRMQMEQPHLLQQQPQWGIRPKYLPARALGASAHRAARPSKAVGRRLFMGGEFFLGSMALGLRHLLMAAPRP